MRDSIINIVRQFEGPGKRGSLNLKKAATSNVCVLKSDNETISDIERYSLGYLKLGKPYVINQFQINLEKRSLKLKLDPSLVSDDAILAAQKFKNSISKCTNYICIIDNQLPKECILLGELNQKWFLAINNKDLESKGVNFIENLKNKGGVVIGGEMPNSNLATINQSISFNYIEMYRVAAKMAFNLLAFEMGQLFVLDKRFDDIRNWIYHGQIENTFVESMDIKNSRERIPKLPDSSHSILISQVQNRLIGIVSLYGGVFEFAVKFCEVNENENLLPEVLGLICDWKNKKEYTLLEHILTIQDESL